MTRVGAFSAAMVLAILGALLAVSGSASADPPDFHGQTLTAPNFSLQDLTGANFSGATIIGGVFVRAKLAGAQFDGATFVSVDGHPTQNNDFTLADLSHATFTGAKFTGITYFTLATLTCADFSGMSPNNGNAVFGDSLSYTPLTTGSCRAKFVGATMNCEFIDQWRDLDLSAANVSACLGKLAGRNFDNAMMPGVHLDNAILDGASFVGAVLTRATMNGVSLQCNAQKVCANLTGATLQGVELNNANLTGASLYNALLSNDVKANDVKSASLNGAHLKNVNFATATLSGAKFKGANFYGDSTGKCGTTAKGNAGFTSGCASAAGATIDGTDFSDAYLYGVDFSGATITGALFDRAVLVAATFAGSSIGASPSSGAVTDFTASYLQGTDLGNATVADADLTDAFFDFPDSNGGALDVYLVGPVHNMFACGTPSTCAPASGADVCLYLSYASTVVPPQNANLTCPNGKDGPCGDPAHPADPTKPAWKSSLTIEKPRNPGPPAGWYQQTPTYGQASNTKIMCNGKGDSTALLSW